MPADHPARWEGAAWLEEVEAWLLPALERRGLTPTGPVERDRVRFWSVIARVETDGGRVWVKENAPSQSFEAGLVEVVHHVVPGAVPTPLAVDRDRGWLATADLGLPMWHDDAAPPLEDWVGVLRDFGALQHALTGHEEAALATGLPRFPESPDDVEAWLGRLVAEVRAHPDGDPRRLDDAEAAAVEAGIPRLRNAAEELAASWTAPSLQHNDLHLGNAFRRPDGGAAFIDLGDALWTHPFTAARIPLWIMANRLELDPDGPELRRATDAYLEPWTDRTDRATLRALLPAAHRLSCLHRAESWRRLQADVPVERVDEPFLRSVPTWLVDAAAPDPHAAAVAW
ncbi:hypothetical protein [Phycicoccus avicenniae]|uniref:hypothetical protein n=1 Tax=Phycicoccus avicenniae TaxID=2828860 RepID=UPI003D2CB48B